MWLSDCYCGDRRRLKRERHVNVAGAERSLQYAYYPTGELHSKQMANGVWTGAYGYDWRAGSMGWATACSPEPTAPASRRASSPRHSITPGADHQHHLLLGPPGHLSYQDNRGWLMGVEARKAPHR